MTPLETKILKSVKNPLDQFEEMLADYWPLKGGKHEISETECYTTKQMDIVREVLAEQGWHIEPRGDRIEARDLFNGQLLDSRNGRFAMGVLAELITLRSQEERALGFTTEADKTRYGSRRFSGAVVAVLLLFTIGATAHAPAATITATNVSYAAVNYALTQCARGDTLVVPAGSATWSSTLSITKGVILIGAGRTNTIISCSTTAISISPDQSAINGGEPFRITGFTFDGQNSAGIFIGLNSRATTHNKPLTNFAVGNCTFQNTASTGGGAIYTQGQNRGCIYSNIFDRCNIYFRALGQDAIYEWFDHGFPQAFGTSDQLFFEGNLVKFSSTFSGDYCGWSESGQGGRFVSRYNQFNYANISIVGEHNVHDIHGFQAGNGLNPFGGQTGTMCSEIYGNSYTNTDSGRWSLHRGGWGLYHNNIVRSGTSSMRVDMQMYPKYPQEWPSYVGGGSCNQWVYGSTAAGIDCNITNTYVWNNYNAQTATEGGVTYGVYGLLCGVAENANFYRYTNSFNGTVGIGRSNTAPTGSATKGVGCWVASTPTPTTDPAVVQAGHLYKATATDTWTDYYTPYTFPHPLSSGQLVIAPQNLSVGNGQTVQFYATNNSGTVPADVTAASFWTSSISGAVSINRTTGEAVVTNSGAFKPVISATWSNLTAITTLTITNSDLYPPKAIGLTKIQSISFNQHEFALATDKPAVAVLQFSPLTNTAVILLSSTNSTTDNECLWQIYYDDYPSLVNSNFRLILSDITGHTNTTQWYLGGGSQSVDGTNFIPASTMFSGGLLIAN